MPMGTIECFPKLANRSMFYQKAAQHIPYPPTPLLLNFFSNVVTSQMLKRAHFSRVHRKESRTVCTLKSWQLQSSILQFIFIALYLQDVVLPRSLVSRLLSPCFISFGLKLMQ